MDSSTHPWAYSNQASNYFDAWSKNWSDGYQFGDFFKSLFGQVNDNNSSVNYNPFAEMWKGFTGQKNTEIANSATAALQEDSQSFNAQEAQKQRDFEAQQAEIARQWQENMSNTAVQRQSADLQSAGFNPWLAANGSGASTGSVGIASGDSASSAQGQGINATKSGAEVLQGVAITAAVMMKLIKLLK